MYHSIYSCILQGFAQYLTYLGVKMERPQAHDFCGPPFSRPFLAPGVGEPVEPGRPKRQNVDFAAEGGRSALLIFSARFDRPGMV